MSTFILSHAAIMGQLANVGFTEADLAAASADTRVNALRAAAAAIAAANLSVQTPMQFDFWLNAKGSAQASREWYEIQNTLARGGKATDVPVGGLQMLEATPAAFVAQPNSPPPPPAGGATVQTTTGSSTATSTT